MPLKKPGSGKTDTNLKQIVERRMRFSGTGLFAHFLRSGLNDRITEYIVVHSDRHN